MSAGTAPVAADLARKNTRSSSSGWNDHSVAGAITASKPSWTAPFSGLSPRAFGKLVTVLQRQGADTIRNGRPRNLRLEDRPLLVVAY